MLTIRPFRNEDPPRLLTLWKKSQCLDNRSTLMPLTMNFLFMQTLGIPFFDPKSISLAFDDEKPVGYVHTTLGPNRDGSDLSTDTGQICFLCVDPGYADPWGAGRALLQAGEQYLLKQGVREIYGGSPRPCVPFYLGFYGGAEPVGFFDTDRPIIQVFQEAGYQAFRKTIRFRLNLKNYSPPTSPNAVGWRSQLRVEIDDLPKAKNWWEACSFANFEWIEAAAYLRSVNRPIARVRVRVADPDTDEDQILYGGTWDAALTDIRVHSDFHQKGVAAFLLGETLRHLVSEGQAFQIEAHVPEDIASLNLLLRAYQWQEVDTGTQFRKEF